MLAQEPLARSRAAGLRFWRRTSEKNAKMSFPFEVPVYGRTRYKTPEKWVRCRVVVRAYKVHDLATGPGYRYRVQIYLVKRETGENVAMLHNVESIESFYGGMKATLHHGAAAGLRAREEMDQLGVSQADVAKYLKEEA